MVAVAVLVEQVGFAVYDSSQRQTPHSVGQPRTFAAKLNRALKQALGSSDRGVRRFQVLAVRSPAGTKDARVVTVRWSINNDLSTGSVGNGAQADVYLIMGHIFSLRAHVARVNLIGTYPIGGSVAERPVMRVWMDQKTANAIDQNGWGAIDAPTLWPLVHRVYVSPDFQPISSE